MSKDLRLHYLEICTRLLILLGSLYISQNLPQSLICLTHNFKIISEYLKYFSDKIPNYI